MRLEIVISNGGSLGAVIYKVIAKLGESDK